MVTLLINLFINTFSIVEYNLKSNKRKETNEIHTEIVMYLKIHRIFIDLVELLGFGFYRVVEERGNFLIIRIFVETYYYGETKEILRFLNDTEGYISDKLKVLEILNNVMSNEKLVTDLLDANNYYKILDELKEG